MIYHSIGRPEVREKELDQRIKKGERMKKVLVTGGSGFIGSHTGEGFIRESYRAHQFLITFQLDEENIAQLSGTMHLEQMSQNRKRSI